jgi:hypothetical protein
MQRPNLPPQQLAHHHIQIGGQIRLVCGRGRRIGADHKQATRREHAKIPVHERTKATFHSVAHHRGANRATNYESYPGRFVALKLRKQVPGKARAPGAFPSAHREREFCAVPHPGFAGQHVRVSRSRTGARKRQALRRARPLWRRAARTARPARVRMRSRKPWVFALRRLFGWNVRLLTGAPEELVV